MSDTGKRIKERRKKLGISADILADELCVSRSTIFRYEKGDIEKVPAESLQKIADILKTSPAYLMGWKDTSNPDTKKDDGDGFPIPTSPELEILKKYRKIDNHGKETINYIIDREYERSTEKIIKLKPRVEEHPYIRAAHNDNQDSDQIDKMNRDIDMLEELAKQKRGK